MLSDIDERYRVRMSISASKLRLNSPPEKIAMLRVTDVHIPLEADEQALGGNPRILGLDAGAVTGLSLVRRMWTPGAGRCAIAAHWTWRCRSTRPR